MKAQFEELRQRLIDDGFDPIRNDEFKLMFSIVVGFDADDKATYGQIRIERRSDGNIFAAAQINGVYRRTDDHANPADALSALMAKPFGRTTIGTVFGLSV